MRETMTPRERLLAAYRCQPVDRVPIRVWGAEPSMKVWHPSFQPILDAALEHTDIVTGWGTWSNIFHSASSEIDVVVSDRPGSHSGFVDRVTTYRIPGGELTQIEAVSTEHKPGRVMKFFIESEAEAELWLSAPYVAARPDVTPFFEKTRELGEAGLVMAYMGSPVYAVYEMIGSERLALWSIDRRDLLREMGKTMTTRLLHEVVHQLENGVGPAYGYVGPELCIPPLMTPQDFEEFVVGPEGEIIRHIRDAGGFVWLHCHGDMGPVLDGLQRMGVAALNPIEPPPMGSLTMRQVRERVGNAMCLEGNIEADDLFRARPGRIRELVRTAIEEARGGGFVLCPTSGFMEWSTASPTQVSNYLEFIQAGLDFGRDFA